MFSARVTVVPLRNVVGDLGSGNGGSYQPVRDSDAALPERRRPRRFGTSVAISGDTAVVGAPATRTRR